MSIFYKRGSCELVPGDSFDTLVFHLQPTRIGKWLGYEPVTRQYLTTNGVSWHRGDATHIQDSGETLALIIAYKSEKLKQQINLKSHE